SPVEHKFKVVPANSTWRVTGSSCRIAPVRRADCVCFVTADEGPAAAAARLRRRGDRISQREFITLLGVALAYPPAPNGRSGEFLSKATRRARGPVAAEFGIKGRRHRIRHRNSTSRRAERTA